MIAPYFWAWSSMQCFWSGFSQVSGAWSRMWILIQEGKNVVLWNRNYFLRFRFMLRSGLDFWKVLVPVLTFAQLHNWGCYVPVPLCGLIILARLASFLKLHYKYLKNFVLLKAAWWIRTWIRISMDLHSFCCPGSWLVLGMRIRMHEHWNSETFDK